MISYTCVLPFIFSFSALTHLGLGLAAVVAADAALKVLSLE